jgi:uncharacterized repeat protein (TIGR02543 family)
MRFRKVCICMSAAAVLAFCTAACKTETSSSAPEYTVTYDANGADSGTVPSAGGNYTAGSTVSVCRNTGNLAKTGYTFAGWNTAADGTGIPYAADGTFIMGNAGVTLYAEWAAGTGTVYTVQYWQENVSDDAYTLVSADTALLAGTTGGTAAYTAKTYPGFTDDTALTTINGTVSTTGTIAADGSTVVKLYYTRNTVTLTFDLAGGTTTTAFTDATGTGGTLTGRYGAAVTMADPVQTGYTFSGWNTPGGTLPETFPASDASYAATWTAVTYSITYNLNGGTNSSLNPSGYTIETETITFASPDRNGYTFAGWYSDASFTARVTQTDSGSTGDMTLYAEWTGGSVNVMVNPGDMTLSCGSTSVKKGGTVTFTASLNGCDPDNIEWLLDCGLVSERGESCEDGVSVDTSSHPSTETLTLDTSDMTEEIHTITVGGYKNCIYYSISARITVCGQEE